MRVFDDLAEIANTINKMHPQAQIYLFGSYASGDTHSESDIDLCVILPLLEKNRFEIMDEIREAIHNKTVCAIDLLLFSNAEFEKNSGQKSKIQYEIAQKGVLINA